MLNTMSYAIELYGYTWEIAKSSSLCFFCAQQPPSCVSITQQCMAWHLPFVNCQKSNMNDLSLIRQVGIYHIFCTLFSINKQTSYGKKRNRKTRILPCIILHSNIKLNNKSTLSSIQQLKYLHLSVPQNMQLCRPLYILIHQRQNGTQHLKQ